MSTELSEMFNHKVRNINSVLLIYTDSGICKNCVKGMLRQRLVRPYEHVEHVPNFNTHVRR